MNTLPPTLALQYDADAYVETIRRASDSPPEAPLGLMGRQVAGVGFLDAFLTHGRRNDLVALVKNRHQAESEYLIGSARISEAWQSSALRVRNS